MEILNEFGFKPELFIAQVINFLILFFVFKRFLYKPLLSLMKKREDTIKKGLDDAHDAALLKEETENNRALILKRTQTEAEKIITEAKKTADELRNTMREETRVETEKMIAEARIQAHAEMEKMEKKITSMSLTLSAELLSKVTKSLFTEEEQKQIVKRTINKLPKN